MIRYALCCDDGHRFDSWFYDSAAFDDQAGRGLVSCPVCESRHVVKAIMAPAVVAPRRGSSRQRANDLATAGLAASSAPMASSEPTAEVSLVDSARRDAARALRDRILAETRDVGRDFAAEARRIHHAEARQDRIRGEATLSEARDLLEDGIMVLPLPALPDDLN